MTEIEIYLKTCMECGAKCDSLILICPNCKSVLPDGEPATYDFTNNKLPSEPIQENDSDVGIGRALIFAIVFGFVIWLLARARGY